MRYFIAVEEDLLQELWIRDPGSVVPFSRPFIPCRPDAEKLRIDPQKVEAHLLARVPLPKASDPLFKYTSRA